MEGRAALGAFGVPCGRCGSPVKGSGVLAVPWVTGAVSGVPCEEGIAWEVPFWDPLQQRAGDRAAACVGDSGMLSLDGEGAAWHPCPAWAPSHPEGLPAVPQALCMWVAARRGESHVLRPQSCSKTKTISKIWAFPKAQVLPEQLSVSPGWGPLAVLGLCTPGPSSGVWHAQEALAHRNY